MKNANADITIRAIGPEDWADIEKLFGANGACGGCWCMWWRIGRHGREWDNRKGAGNRRDFKKLVTAGNVRGCLACSGDEPVGWCCLGPRGDFPKLQNTKGLRTQWDENTWSITCFFIKSGWRGRGVATQLLVEAVNLARDAGAAMIEAYPVNTKPGQKMAAAFAWTGVPALFRKAGFKKTRLKGASRDVYLLPL